MCYVLYNYYVHMRQASKLGASALGERVVRSVAAGAQGV